MTVTDYQRSGTTGHASFTSESSFKSRCCRTCLLASLRAARAGDIMLSRVDSGRVNVRVIPPAAGRDRVTTTVTTVALPRCDCHVTVTRISSLATAVARQHRARRRQPCRARSWDPHPSPTRSRWQSPMKMSSQPCSREVTRQVGRRPPRGMEAARDFASGSGNCKSALDWPTGFFKPSGNGALRAGDWGSADLGRSSVQKRQLQQSLGPISSAIPSPSFRTWRAHTN